MSTYATSVAEARAYADAEGEYAPRRSPVSHWYTLGRIITDDAELLARLAEELPADCPARQAFDATMAQAVAEEGHALQLRKARRYREANLAAAHTVSHLQDLLPLHQRGLLLALSAQRLAAEAAEAPAS